MIPNAPRHSELPQQTTAHRSPPTTGDTASAALEIPGRTCSTKSPLIQTISGLDASNRIRVLVQSYQFSEGDSPYSPRGRAFTNAAGNILPTVTISASQTIVNGFQTVTLTSTTDDPDGDVTDFALERNGGHDS